MSRNASGSTDQYSPFEQLPAGPIEPTLAQNSFREALAGAAVASVAFPAAILAVSVPGVAAVAAAVVTAALLARRATGRRRKETRVERDAPHTRSTESAGTGTVSMAD